MTRITSNPLFPDLLSPYVSNKAQNGNQGSIWAYLFPQVLVTGLIGAFLITFFRIPAIRAGIRNRQLCGEENRPYYSLLAGRSLFRWAGVGGNGKEHLFWGWWFSGIRFCDAAGRVIGMRNGLPTLSPKDTTFWISSGPILCKKLRIPAHVLKIRV